MSTKVMIILIAVFILILGAMGGGFFLMWSKIEAANQAPITAEEKQAEKQKPAIDETGPLHPLETFIVNLADEGENRYLRVTMTLEVREKALVDTIQKGLPQIRNAVLMTVPTKKYNEINTLEGKDALRNELIAQINNLLPPESITNIYFTEFVVQ